MQKNVTRVAFCSGKVYYDLIERREKEGANDIAFIRLEQLYPFPQKQIGYHLEKYNKAKDFHLGSRGTSENMGPWRFVDNNLRSLNLKYYGRSAAASPATVILKTQCRERRDDMTNIFSKYW